MWKSAKGVRGSL